MPPTHNRGASASRLALAGLLALFLAGCASSGSGEGASEPAAPANPPTPAPAQAAPEEPPQEDPVFTAAAGGIFTEAQSDRGRTTFDEVCSECHTTSEFRGRTFQNNWGRRTVYSLYRTVRSTMPDDNPGGLEEQIYLDVVSYILRINGHDPGSSELAPDSPMRDVRIALPSDHQ